MKKFKFDLSLYLRPSLILFIILVLFSIKSEAAIIKSSSVKYENNKFIVDIVGHVKSDPKNITTLLTDFNNLKKLNPKIIESKIVKRNADHTIVKVVAKGCIWLFCKKIINTQKVNFFDKLGHIKSQTIPSSSNLKSGEMSWKILKNGNQTKITYHAKIETDFFIPLFIISHFIKKEMLEEAKIVIKKVEELSLY